MADSSRRRTQIDRSRASTASLVFSLLVTLAILIQPFGAVAATPLPLSARSLSSISSSRLGASPAIGDLKSILSSSTAAAHPVRVEAREPVAVLPVRPASPSAQIVSPSTTITVSILSTPHATHDSNSDAGPSVWVVEAVITNTGSTTATTPIIDLDMNSDANWYLLPGESRQRTLASIPAGGTQVNYWFAHRSNTIGDQHTYTVTVSAANVDTVTQSLNAYENPGGHTVDSQSAISTGNNGVASTAANISVGVAFTMSVDYDMGTGASGVNVQPNGDLGFNSSAYRLLSNEVQFRNGSNVLVGPLYQNRLYFPPGSLPTGAQKVNTTYTFVALRPGNTTLCPYTDVRYTGNKYDKSYCVGLETVNITGTLTFSFTKSVNATTVQEGQLLTYTLRYTNTGTQPIQNTYIWDHIPSQTITATIQPAPDPTTDFNTADRVVWNIGSVAAGATGSVTLTVLVNGRGADLPNGTTLVNDGFMGILFNPTAEEPAITSTTTSIVQAPTIAISKDDNQTNVIQGQQLTYTLRVTNTGSVAAENVVVTDVMPSGVTFSSATPSQGTGCSGTSTVVCSLGTLAPSASGKVTLKGSVDFKLADGILLTNTMQTQYSNGAGYTFAVQSASDVDIVQSPILSIDKSDFPDPIPSNRTLTYTLRITNTGSADATNVVITDVLPANTTYVSCSGGSGCGINASNVISWSVASISPATTDIVNLVVHVAAGLSSGTTIVNQDYGVLSDQTDFLAGAPETTTVLNEVAVVRGRTFLDANGNGVLDAGEAGISGITVTLPGALQPVTVTNASGQYTFTLESVLNTPISVDTALPAGFFRTTPSPVFLTATVGTTTTLNFGYCDASCTTFGVIYGTVFDDSNHDGLQELGENGLSGVSISSSGAATTPVSTNLFGQYVLSYTVPNTYTVSETTNPPNYVSTTPDSVDRFVPLGASSQVDFGDFLGARIQGKVFNDLDVNAVNNAEPGVSGALVAADNDSMTTDATGVYTLFVTVQTGQPITVTETDPPDWVSTTANPGSPALIRLDPNTLLLNSPQAGVVYSNNDFGDALASGVISITGQVFNDSNADGNYNDGGFGLPGGQVRASTGMFITTTAAGNGNFTLYGPPGTAITVTETNPPGYISTNAIPGNDASKFDLDTLRVSSLVVGTTSAGNYFGDVILSSASIITGVLFNDANNNSAFDTGESTFSGQQVTISGTASLITTTNTNGLYTFAVGAGTYLISSNVPGGYTRTTPSPLALTTVTGTLYPNRNFGFSNSSTAATIYGTVFNDFNGNGVQDLGELGLPGAVIRLFSGATNVATYTTGVTGTYAFKVTTPGVWQVRETNPPGYYSTSSDQLNVQVTLGNSYGVNFGDSNRQEVGSVHGLVFNDVNANGVQDSNEVGISGVVITTTAEGGGVVSATTGFAGQYTYGFDFVSSGFHTIHEIDKAGYRSTTPNAVVVFVQHGQAQVVDFGDCQIGVCSSAIQGIVFNDANGNGNQDLSELGIPGVTVSLYNGATLIATTTTGPNGNYTFGIATPGTYRVIETDLFTYHSTTPNEVHVSVGSTPATYIVNFGDSNNSGVSSIFGTVFNDANANSVFDSNEVGIPNVPVRIAGNFSGIPITNVTTNLLGQYTFLIDLISPSNVFTVSETDLPGYISSTPNVVAQTVALGNGYTVNFGDLIAPVCAADSYEALNDNFFNTTGVVLTTTSQLHNFFSPNDQDWLKVTLTKGFSYTFTTNAIGARADTSLALFAPDGVTLLARSDDYSGSQNFSSRVNWIAAANGTHYLRVTQLTPALAGCFTDYSISMTVTPRYYLELPIIVRNYP